MMRRTYGWIIAIALALAAGGLSAPRGLAQTGGPAPGRVFLPLVLNGGATGGARPTATPTATATPSATATAAPGTGFALLLSRSPDRSDPVPLQGQTVNGGIYVFVSPEYGVSRVDFYLDDPEMTAAAYRAENTAPWDLAGGMETANAFDTYALSNGDHTVTAAVYVPGGGRQVVSAGFIVSNTGTGTTCNADAAYDQVHLSWPEEPSTTLTVIWRTCEATTPSTVQHRAAGSAAGWQTAFGSLRASGTAGTLHEATLRSLSPATAYEYRVQGDGGVWSEIFTARTAPQPGPADFSAIYVADTGLIGRTDGLASGTQWVIEEIARLSPTVVLGGGDYTYFDTDKRYGTYDNSIDAWFNQMQKVISRSPLMAQYGNHEVELDGGWRPWAQRFAHPRTGPAGDDEGRNYSFDVGDVHFVALLAATDKAGLTDGQLQWFEQDVNAARARGMRWIIPYYHVTPFGDGKNHGPNLLVREHVGPLFEKLGVQIAIASHDQAYERSYPLVDVPATNRPTSTSLSCYTMDDGTTYVKVSPGGKESNISGAFSPFASAAPPAWTAARDNTMHHFARLVVSGGGSITFEAWGVPRGGGQAEVIDRFTYTLGSCP